MYIKNFLDWFKLKPRLDAIPKRPFFNEREVWNCHWGENIGFELDGKNSLSIRPVLVFKKLTRDTLLAIPMTSKIKNGSWYIKSNLQNKEGRYIISQIRVIDAKRLNNKISQINNDEFKNIVATFAKFIQN